MKLLLALCAATLFVLVNSYRRRPTGVVDNADCPKSCKKACLLFSLKSNQVSASVFRTMILPYEWSGIYTIELQQGSAPAFGKYHVKWVESGGTFKRILPTFNIQERKCVDVSGESVITETKCGVKLVQETPTYWSDRFFSQDPSEYLWYEICETSACDKGFIDLLVRKTRTAGGKEIDLDKVPWHKIAADLKTWRGITMDDPTVRYLWVDQECPFT